ncbi:MAG: hypothetical protein PVG22_12455 [Chromatiales bacterium]|jgi:hypothetical protein
MAEAKGVAQNIKTPLKSLTQDTPMNFTSLVSLSQKKFDVETILCIYNSLTTNQPLKNLQFRICRLDQGIA